MLMFAEFRGARAGSTPSKYAPAFNAHIKTTQRHGHYTALR